MNRRIATDQDLKIDAIVYRGKGKTAFRIVAVLDWTERFGYVAYGIVKLGTASLTMTNATYVASDLMIED